MSPASEKLPHITPTNASDHNMFLLVDALILSYEVPFAISVEAYSTPIFQLKHLIHNPAGLELMLTFLNLQKYGNTLIKN
ncbi:MAG: hypothetical protein P4L41_03095 [Flavipsychrobacter sp.]|nr:hypothetical protein [Flavipsychrobacter sp.]